jgi:predicted enzyme related to lactoylglutathione lyase
MNAIAYFEIQSSEPAREIIFYTQLFGWVFIKEHLPGIEYYRIETKTMHGGLLKRLQPLPESAIGINAFVNAIEVKDFNAISQKIIALGGKVAVPKFPIPGRCWQGYFTDLDNNTFGVFEVDAQAGN